jgi:putative DNA methylase
MQPKKLIEVAMPIKEISAESVRDKSIRHGHISTLHLWWARRPLPVCRAVVFASLVPDPLDENCPRAFKDAVELILGREKNTGDPYKPYDDIPYTAAIDKMEDNLRNRLLMFIGKYSNEFSANEKAGKTTPSGKQLNDASLIKWDNKNNKEIIGKARKLIWVAHNARNGETASTLIAEFDETSKAIEAAEDKLYNIKDRHLSNEDIRTAEISLKNAIEAFLDKMPKVFDPFAGGGAIPLEASRLGCRSFGNDINPVAHIIQKGGLEFPQKFGKPIIFSKEEFIKLYGEELWQQQPQEDKKIKNGEAVAIRIANRLSFDVEFHAKKLLALSKSEIGHLYPDDEKGNKPIAYFWARIGICINPSCKAEVPLLRQFYLVNKSSKQIFLNPIITGNKIDFEIKNGSTGLEGWINRGNLVCPCCGNTTENSLLKKQFIDKKVKDRIIAVIEEGRNSKVYRLPNKKEIEIIELVKNNIEKPNEILPVEYTKAMAFCLWGFDRWGDIFSDRQITAMYSLVKSINSIKLHFKDENLDYRKAVILYLAILVDRISTRQISLSFWDITRETATNPFGKQAIQMVFDYIEVNPFCESSGSALNQLDWITRYIESECNSPFSTVLQNASSGEKEQFPEKYITAVITDPPYYDAIAYADLSDFFYLWLKRTLPDLFPLNFATPQTPKTEECTALKHHHNGKQETAKKHFENKLLQIFDAIEHQTSDLVSIMFAHQSTEAWTTLCDSILGANMNITGSWALDSEYTNTGLKSGKAFLSSSVTVSCRPAQRKGFGNYKEVKKAIERTVSKEVDELYRLGFRGADLLTACFGQAVSEFGKYEKVEKADGSEVTVAELLEMARESAFNALLKGFDGDDFTKFYIGWLQLYGFAESDFDDAAKFSRVGLSIDVQELFTEHILIKKLNKQTLGTFEQRINANKNLGERSSNFLIDQVHRAMALYKGTNRRVLLQYIEKVAAQPENSFWRVVTSLCEVLPVGSEDHKQGIGLITNKESLIRESKTIQIAEPEQTKLL